MAIYRDPATGLLRSDNRPAGVNLPSRQTPQVTSPLPQINAQPARQPLTLGRAFLNAPGELAQGAGDALKFGGGLLKEIANFVGRPAAAPFAIASEEIPALLRGTPVRSNPLSRYAFQNTEPNTAARGWSALSRGAETASFLPEALGAYGSGGVSSALKAGSLSKAAPILAGAGLRSAAVESPFGAVLGFLDAKRRGASNQQALEQAAAGTALAGGIAFGLPFAGYGISRAVGPFIPSLSRTASEATEGAVARSAARDTTEAAVPSALPRTAAQEAGQSVLPAAETPAAIRAVSRETAQEVIPTIATSISDEAAAAAVARSANKEEATAIIGALRRSAPDVFDTFGEANVQKIIRTLDEVSPGTGTAAERAVANRIVQTNIARQGAEATAGEVNGVLPRIRNFVAAAKEKLVDKTAPVEDVLTKIENDLGTTILPQRDIRLQFDRIFTSKNIADQFLKDSGLAEVATEAERRGAFDELQQYLIARQAEDIRSVNPTIELGRSAAQDRAIIKSLQGTVGDLAQRVNIFGQRVLDKAVEGGLVGREAAAELKRTYPHYVPVNRVFSAIEERGGYGGRGALASLGSQNVVQRLVGSKRAIANPLESLVDRTRQTFVQVERNKAAQMMAGYRNLPGNPFGIKELIKGAEPTAGKVRFNALVDGVKKSFEIDKQFGDVIASATPFQLDVISKAMLLPTRILKAGATGFNIPFTLFNLLKDQISGVLNSSSAAATANPYVFMRALFAVAKQDDLFKLAAKEGAVTTSYALLRDNAAFSLSRARAGASVRSAIAHIIRNPKELISIPIDIVEGVINKGEQVRRVQEFAGQRAQLLKEGASEETANLLGADAARFVTANFYRHGSWGRVLNAAIPYLNAGIQSTRSFFRAASDGPVKTAAKVASFVMMPFAVATAWNLMDSERKAAYDDIPDWEKENNLVIIPPNPTKDAQGRWNVYKIPLPPNVGSMVIPIRQTFEAAHGLDPNRFAGMAQALVGTATPLNLDFKSKTDFTGSVASQFTPQIIKPTLESYTNKNFFTGAPIVPESMSDLPPEMQVRPNTSQTARLIGAQLGVSPLKVENFLKSSGGTVASQAINAVDRSLAGTPLNPDSIVGGESITGNIVRRTTKATGGESLSRLYEQAGALKTEGRAKTAAAKQSVESIVAQIQGAPQSKQSSILAGIKDPNVAKDVLAGLKDAQLGLTKQDKIIKSLGVEDGSRAKFILQLEKGMSPEERAKFEQDLLIKKVMTRDVYRQLMLLR